MVESYSHYLDFDTSQDDIDFGDYDGPDYIYEDDPAYQIEIDNAIDRKEDEKFEVWF